MVFKGVLVCALLAVVLLACTDSFSEGHRDWFRRRNRPNRPCGNETRPSVPPKLINFLVCIFNNTDVPQNFNFTKPAFEVLFDGFNATAGDSPLKDCYKELLKRRRYENDDDDSSDDDDDNSSGKSWWKRLFGGRRGKWGRRGRRGRKGCNGSDSWW